MALTDEERSVESLKLAFEWHKHLTTLISGIVLALVTVLQAFFDVGKTDRPYNQGEILVLALCFFALAVGLVVSIVAMNLTIRQLRTAQEPPRSLQLLIVTYPIMTLIGGLLFFVVFAYSRTIR